MNKSFNTIQRSMNTQIQCKNTGRVLEYEFWLEVYKNKLEAWDTLEASQLIEADIILGQLKVIK